MKLFHLLPLHIHSVPEADIDMSKVTKSLAFWEADLPDILSLKHEVKDWFKRWCAPDIENVPESLLDALTVCDSDIYPCINRLLTLGRTLPVTTCEAERSFSTLR